MINTIFFSKNRPLQLDLALSSFYLNCMDAQNDSVTVLYKADDEYKHAYAKLKEEFCHQHIWFVEEKNFKEDLLTIIKQPYPAEFTLFAVDDCIFTAKFSFSRIMMNMNASQYVLGFSLRLGKNINYVYTINKEQKLPLDISLNEKVFVFNWVLSEYDFNYPMDLSSSIYRNLDILPLLENLNYDNPNSLEALLDYTVRFGNTKYQRNKPLLASYPTSVAFCNPINKVQTVAKSNRAGNQERYAPENLLALYNDDGLRVSPYRFQEYISRSVHEEVDLW